MYYEKIKTECLIVGSGAAGLRAAIACLENKKNVLLLSKGLIGESHSLIAKGGMNAAIGQRDPSDNWQIHYNDTIEAGRFINNEKMVEILCKEAPNRVYDLLKFGAGFRIDEQTGKPIQVRGPSGGQSKDRVITVADFIGFVLVRTLAGEALKKGLKFLPNALLLKLLLDDCKKILGVLVFDLKNEKFLVIESPVVVLACGGAGFLFSVTTNPPDTTGECYILALEVGLELRDMEMVQFHPTTLAYDSLRGVLVTEGARGIGGRLFNSRGERFMHHYDRKRLELSTRDVISRAIYKEIIEGRGGPNGGVYLDLSHLNPKIIQERLPDLYRTMRDFVGIDITQQRFEVLPGAHHIMGGVTPHDPETMETEIEGLFICGEIAWGCHGANRLGGNALIETQVFGELAGRNASNKHRKRVEISNNLIREEIKSMINEWQKYDFFKIIESREQLRKIMFEKVGIIRNKNCLEEALKEVRRLKEIAIINSKRKSISKDIRLLFETLNMLKLGEVIIQSALERTESRGAHYREDYPNENSELYNTYVKFVNNEYKIGKRFKDKRVQHV